MEEELNKMKNDVIQKIAAEVVKHSLLECEEGLEPAIEVLTWLATNNKLSMGACKEYAKKVWDARVLIKKYTSEMRNGNFNPSLQKSEEIMEELADFSNTMGELKLICELNQ